MGELCTGKLHDSTISASHLFHHVHFREIHSPQQTKLLCHELRHVFFGYGSTRGPTIAVDAGLYKQL